MAESKEEQRNLSYLTKDKIVKSKLKSIELIEGQISEALRLTWSTDHVKQDSNNLAEIRSLLLGASTNIKTFKEVCRDEGMNYIV